MNKPLIMLFITTLLTGCSDSTDNDYVPADVCSHKVKYAGTWHNNSTVFDSEDLLLADNGTFIYSDESCTKHHHSKGHWRLDGNCISLLSDSVYRRAKVDVTTIPCKIGGKSYTLTTTSPAPTFNFEDSLYFDNVRIAIVGDTVIEHDIFLNRRLVRQ